MNKKLLKRLENWNNPKIYAPVSTIKDYFNLPIKDREKFGFWYKLPQALPCNILLDEDERGGWAELYKLIRKKYPIQWFIREYLFSFDFPPYKFIKLKYMSYEDWKYKVKCFFKPHHQRIRKSIPNTWKDISSLIIDVNFAMILDFYYGEVKNGWIDWESDEKHKEFYLWILSAKHYIEVRRRALEIKIDNSYPPKEDRKKKLPYNELYAKLHAAEKELKDGDDKILIDMIKFREMFWS